ncbi:unnamed protein product [Closterium sp. Naga37s-1]|nr:unnamed protein product [Closterium sp. Naga37s-1]
MNQRVDSTGSAAAEGGFDSYRDGRDARRCLNELQTSLSSFIPAKADISSDAAAAHNEASPSLLSLDAPGGRLDSFASRSLALSSLQDVLRLDTPLSPRYWPLNRVASLLRSFPELTSLHLPFLSHLGAGPSLGEGTYAGCDYIDAICHIVAPCCPSLRHCHIEFDPACTVTCSSAPFSHLSLLSHLELQMGSDWAKAYPVPRLYDNMFSGLRDTLTSLTLTLPFMAHLPLSIWELTALRSLSIRNPAFHPGVQRHAYEAGVSGLRHLSCLQLLGHPVPGLMMAALGETHPETTGRDGVEQQQHQLQEEQLGIGGNEQQQQQRGGQGGEEASRTQQLEQLRMSRGTVAMLNAHQLVGPAAHPAAPATPATPATPAAPAAPAALAANAASTAPFAPAAGEGAGEGRRIAELELSLPPSSPNLSAWTFLPSHRPASGCLSSLVFT